MAYLRYSKRSRSNWVAANYLADETSTVLNVAIGDVVGPSFGRVRVAFDGTNSDATLALGDAVDPDRFITTTNSDASNTSLFMGTGGSGSTYLAIGQHLYTTADTIDVTFTKDDGDDGAVGTADFWVYVAKADPH